MDHDVKIAQQKLACEKIHSSETPSVIFLTHELQKKKNNENLMREENLIKHMQVKLK
jgi:hypothetical protein